MMLDARIELRGDDLFCAEVGSRAVSRKRLSDGTLSRVQDWAARYDTAVRSREPSALPTIGRQIADFLNEGDAWLDRSLQGTGEVGLEIAVSGTPGEPGRALLDVPWEILAPGSIFLAADETRLFRVARRLGAADKPSSPAHRDLALLFMAADVEGEGVLNYELEVGNPRSDTTA